MEAPELSQSRPQAQVQVVRGNLGSLQAVFTINIFPRWNPFDSATSADNILNPTMSPNVFSIVVSPSQVLLLRMLSVIV